MYAELKVEFDSNEINFQQSSNLQGVLMENISSEYAEKLHGNQLNPYSQCILKEEGKTIWYLKTLLNKTVRIKEDKELIKEFYENKCSRYLELSFKTPTSFKRDGKYVIYPDLSLIYGSLMRKFSAASEEFNMYDEDTLEELVTQSEIVRYRLQTIPFPLEKTNITGFIGNICIHIKGPETMARYVRMLAKFGEFSGVGIKTGMGMGAMKYIRRNEDD